MNQYDAIKELNQNLRDELAELAGFVKVCFNNSTAHQKSILAYQIINELDSEVRFNIIVTSDAEFSSTPYTPAAYVPFDPTEVLDAKLTVYIQMVSRKGNANFTFGYDPANKSNMTMITNAAVGLDEMIPWVWMAGQEKDRLQTIQSFPTTNVVDVTKTIHYTIDLGDTATVGVGATLQLAVSPAVTNSAASANSWSSDIPSIATVTQWVEGGSLGGLVTGVSPGVVTIRNSLSKAKIIITVV